MMTKDKVVREINSCRSCDSKDLVEILSLGKIHVSDFVDSQPGGEGIPLELVLCDPEKKGCGLLQLKHTTSPDYLYRHYWYKSGINESMVRALNDITNQVEKLIDFKKGDLVLDIGCNDGTLLRSYSSEDIIKVGFEPAENLVDDAKKGTDEIINDFFNYDLFQNKFDGKKAKVITSIAMFYDLDKPNKFVSDIKKCLSKDGVWIIEMRYLPSMLEQNSFDNICHEHLEYYSLLSLENLLKRHCLEIFDVELNDVNGGSFRTYISHSNGNSVEPFSGAEARVNKIIENEKKIGLHEKRTYKNFASRVEDIKSKLYSFVKGRNEEGKTIHVYGASTKGNTILQYCDLDNNLIEAAAERDHTKVGKETIGTSIPIITEEESRERADYYLVLPWHFLDTFKEREEEFLRSGGKFIVPLSDFKVIGYEDLEMDD